MQGLQAICNLTSPVSTADPTSYMVQQCAWGYHGPICSLCGEDPTQRYGRTGTVNCQPCRSKGVILLAYIASNLLVLMFLMYTTHLSLKENEEAVEGLSPGRASELIRVRLEPECICDLSWFMPKPYILTLNSAVDLDAHCPPEFEGD